MSKPHSKIIIRFKITQKKSGSLKNKDFQAPAFYTHNQLRVIF